MRTYNVILIYNRAADRLLMCKRLKEPYKGLYNLVGGAVEPGEDGLSAAYREMFEETGITRAQITLVHLMDFTYYLSDCQVEVYAGRLKADVEVYGEENELFWSTLDHNFFDPDAYAGEGNIGHMVEQVLIHKDVILRDV